MDEPLDVEELSQRYGPMVLRRCRQLLRDEDEAMDVCQDVFCLNRIRDRVRRGETAEDGLLERIASAEDTAKRSEARQILSRLFGREPESSRTIAVLHYLDGLTLEQVGEVVGLSTSGVHGRLARLRRSLQALEKA